METVSRTVQLPKETAEFGMSLEKFVGHVRQALADGWQPTQDLPVILASAVADLGMGMVGMQGAIAEGKASPAKVAQALAISATEIADGFLQAPVAVAAVAEVTEAAPPVSE